MRNMRAVVFLFILLVGCLTACMPQTRLALLRSVNAPGTILTVDSLFMDEAEVSNLHWLEYLHFMRQDSADAFYQSQKPDTTALTYWLKARHDTVDIYTQYYFRYPGFRYFPLVGVTQEQAVNYCRWRTAKVREGYLQSAKFQKKHRRLLRQYDVSVTYRLPTVAEWEAAATGGLNPAVAPFGIMRPATPGAKLYRYRRIRHPAYFYACLHKQNIPFGKNERLFKMEFNVREIGYVGSSLAPFRCGNTGNQHFTFSDGFEITEYIYSYPPNGFGLYNMIGNVAELTATPGIAKGGSFENSIHDITLKTEFKYDGPQEWLGFRCACVVELRRKPGVR